MRVASPTRKCRSRRSEAEAPPPAAREVAQQFFTTIRGNVGNLANASHVAVQTTWSALKAHLKQKLEQRQWLDRIARGPLALPAALARSQMRATNAEDGDCPVLVHSGWSSFRGVTGPFGEESAGRWRPLDDVAYAWLSWRRRVPGRAGWFDIHATRTSIIGTSKRHQDSSAPRIS